MASLEVVVDVPEHSNAPNSEWRKWSPREAGVKCWQVHIHNNHEVDDKFGYAADAGDVWEPIHEVGCVGSKVHCGRESQFNEQYWLEHVPWNTGVVQASVNGDIERLS